MMHEARLMFHEAARAIALALDLNGTEFEYFGPDHDEGLRSLYQYDHYDVVGDFAEGTTVATITLIEPVMRVSGHYGCDFDFDLGNGDAYHSVITSAEDVGETVRWLCSTGRMAP
jgi:hypothetical protein